MFSLVFEPVFWLFLKTGKNELGNYRSRLTICKITSNYQNNTFDQLDVLKFSTFKYSDYRAYDQENIIDPDNNFYNLISSNCKYYSDQQFNENFCGNIILTVEVCHLFALIRVI